MPELPEVETVCRGLTQTILDRKIVSVKSSGLKLRDPIPNNFSEKLEGRVVKNISRRAKYILVQLDDDNVLIAHLGMSGRMVVHNNFRNLSDKHDHAIFRFDDGKELVFNDPRRFGLLTIASSESLPQHKLIANLGIEPLTEEFDGKYLHDIMKKKNTPIKIAIMDASMVVGVGNIYACEALFRSRISPFRPASSLSSSEYGELVNNIKEILLAAIESGGSTLKDYVKSSGEKGYFQHSFKVYGREDENCVTCSNIIKRAKQGGRSTFYCEKCQK